MNNLKIIGRIVKDPELRRTTSNKSVANFTVAVNRRSKDDPSDFITCIAWEKRAEFVEKFLGKGNRVFVSGRMESRSCDKSDGNKVQIWELIVEDVEPIDWKDKAETPTPTTPKKSGYRDFDKEIDDAFDKQLGITDDQLPF